MISKILILAGVIAVGQGTFVCPKNEWFKITTCSDKCSDLGKTCNIFTSKLRCVCIPSCARNDQNRCVPKAACCTGQNEVYSRSGYDKKCSDLLQKTFIKPKPREGCYCIPNFYRDFLGRCVSEAECYPSTTTTTTTTPAPTPTPVTLPPQCYGKNEVYKKNGCENKCNPNSNVLEKCVPSSGCFCKAPFARNVDTGECIDPSMCPCGKNECYVQYGGCEEFCNGDFPILCPNVPRCFCLKGYKRNSDGECTPEDECTEPCHSCGDSKEIQQI